MRGLRWVQVATFVAGLAACHADFDVPPGATTNAPPFAHPGTGSTYLVGSTVTLDATASLDRDGEVRSYRWSVSAAPSTSTTSLADPTAPVTSAVLDVVGRYDFELVVTDSDGLTNLRRVTFFAAAPAITVNAGSDATTSWRTTVQLTGTYAVEADVAATFSWSLVSQPPASTATIANATTLTPSLVPDAEGTFVVRLTVATKHSSASDEVSITSNVPRQLISYSIVDVEYSSALDRFVTVSDNPPRLHTHDPATNTDAYVNLTYAPTHVSVSPNGLRAAVAHNGAVTIVNLQTLAPTFYQVALPPLSDIVFGADNRVHCFPASQINSIQTLDLSSATLTSADYSLFTGSYGRLHPSGTKLYAVDGHNLRNYNVATSPVSYTRSSPYALTYELGQHVFFSADGSLLITRPGNVFRTTDDAATDLYYRGNVAGSHQWVTGSSALGTIITATYDSGSNNAREVRVFNASTLALIKATPVPPTPHNGTYYASYPWRVAYRSDLSRIYVLAIAGDAGWVIYEVDP